MEKILDKYQLDSRENREFLRQQADALLSFGHRFPSPEGSSWYLGTDGTPWTDRPRETWITCRMAHVYSIGTLLGHEGSEALTDAALRGIQGELKDREHGGWFPGRTAAGDPLPEKQCYAHAFVILAACSAMAAGRPGAEELLREALSVYDRYFWDEKEGLARDTWDTAFSVCSDYRGLNANMHTVEAFLAVADTTGREEYRERAGRIIRRVISWAEESGWRIPEHFAADWTPRPELNRERPDDPFKPYGATPGHGIEWARLITQWTLSSCGAGAKEKPPFVEAAENLFLRAVGDAWQADGAPGIVYTTDWNGAPVVHDRMHWTLAEAINTSAVLARVTGKAEYRTWYAAFLRYLDESVIDRKNGSWFHQLNRRNEPKDTVWPGKSDLYHALQSMLIPYARPDRSIVPALKG